MPTLKDIAKLAHVDISTVSRALNDSPYVHPNTKKRILEAANELKYHSNSTKEVFTTGKVHAVGIIIPNAKLNIFMDFIQQAELQADAVNYDVIVCLSNDDGEKEKRLLQKMRAGLVDGIIIASTGDNNSLLEDINSSGTPIVQIFREVDQNLDSISIDYSKSVETAFNVLIEKDCKQIGLVNGPICDISYKNKSEAYQRLATNYDLPIIVQNTKDYPKSFVNAGYNLAKKLLKASPNIDAILTANDPEALGVTKYLNDQNIPIPEKIKVISLAGSTLSDLLPIKVSATVFPIDEVSLHALSLIISKVEKLDRDSPLKHLKVNVEYISRMTC
ncbi:hypothetical protein FD03_GL001308 [Companilactobacillus nodensis DSM 19682 = JCM 14932 = NBRC 107160]|uniref:HTH lacI-type domain-containing protein n=1 Tax=Companilactobacillus nodensis DSM 19682 = JCM 14932 = NBRC 107160 TaxID=1423775 RepID=A0A0R1K5Y0_9LACO|nr:LacI family DNA-binding transcriptional regulator [Companilactobacillus nodensis]KRK78949.1 hypothetical protein FD03_GL001308 [Companilactobacillus nodensis DSM 19682 = JCM 14932 = NBRC 107160]